jgi:ABC-type bacteriocin/lantibiotic exporter with double-glycine peptidase domain
MGATMKRQKLIAIAGLSMLFAGVACVVAFVWFLQTPNADKKLSAWLIHANYLGSDGMVLQTKRNTCGPSALKMVFDHYHVGCSLAELEHGVHLSKEGSSMLALKEMVELKGLRAEGWRLTLDDLLTKPLPAILFVHNDHYIVMDSACGDEVFVRDPAIGTLKIEKQKLLKIWNGETLLIDKRE